MIGMRNDLVIMKGWNEIEREWLFTKEGLHVRTGMLYSFLTLKKKTNVFILYILFKQGGSSLILYTLEEVAAIAKAFHILISSSIKTHHIHPSLHHRICSSFSQLLLIIERERERWKECSLLRSLQLWIPMTDPCVFKGTQASSSPQTLSHVFVGLLNCMNASLMLLLSLEDLIVLIFTPLFLLFSLFLHTIFICQFLLPDHTLHTIIISSSVTSLLFMWWRLLM